MKNKIGVISGMGLLLSGVTGLLFSDNISKKTKVDDTVISYTFGAIAGIGAFILAYFVDRFLVPEEEEEKSEKNELEEVIAK